MKKPTAATIRAHVPLTVIARRDGADPISCCGVCGVAVDPSDLPLTVWRECGENDKPIAGHVALLFVGPGSAHAACRKRVDDHPRLYVEESGQPGHFPELCGPCIFRNGLSCGHAGLKANGGDGLAITLDRMTAIICTRGAGCHTPVQHATKCRGRKLLGEGTST